MYFSSHWCRQNARQTQCKAWYLWWVYWPILTGCHISVSIHLSVIYIAVFRHSYFCHFFFRNREMIIACIFNHLAPCNSPQEQHLVKATIGHTVDEMNRFCQIGQSMWFLDILLSCANQTQRMIVSRILHAFSSDFLSIVCLFLTNLRNLNMTSFLFVF